VPQIRDALAEPASSDVVQGVVHAFSLKRITGFGLETRYCHRRIIWRTVRTRNQAPSHYVNSFRAGQQQPDRQCVRSHILYWANFPSPRYPPKAFQSLTAVCSCSLSMPTNSSYFFADMAANRLAVAGKPVWL
jgi:hypothetical protein